MRSSSAWATIACVQLASIELCAAGELAFVVLDVVAAAAVDEAFEPDGERDAREPSERYLRSAGCQTTPDRPCRRPRRPGVAVVGDTVGVDVGAAVVGVGVVVDEVGGSGACASGSRFYGQFDGDRGLLGFQVGRVVRGPWAEGR